jgi:hypothetical protein
LVVSSTTRRDLPTLSNQELQANTTARIVDIGLELTEVKLS